MSKLHDLRNYVMAMFSKYTRHTQYYRVFVYRKFVHSLKSLPSISVLQSLHVCNEVFWNVIGIQYTYDGHTFFQEVSQSTCKGFTPRKD